MKFIYSLIIFLFLISCGSTEIKNKNHKNLIFNDIKSTYEITDVNNYKCETIDKSVIKHVLENGVIASDRDIHDYYSTVGCSISGTLNSNNEHTTFSFDYGGILKLGTGQTIACGKTCCENNFKYCTWDNNRNKNI